MEKSYFIVTIILFAMGCTAQKSNDMHIFYLHGMIIEIQGVNAVSEQFGEYRYNDIINTFEKTGAKVHHEVRTQKTNFETFCKKVSNQIDELITNGVRPDKITVVGASKGAQMAMNISDMNTHPINYVLLGANSDRLEQMYDWKLHGNILGIYEKSDNIAGKNYQYWIDKSKDAVKFEQMEINTGLSHGFLYRPIKEWMEPINKIIKKR